MATENYFTINKEKTFPWVTASPKLRQFFLPLCSLLLSLCFCLQRIHLLLALSSVLILTRKPKGSKHGRIFLLSLAESGFIFREVWGRWDKTYAADRMRRTKSSQTVKGYFVLSKNWIEIGASKDFFAKILMNTLKTIFQCLFRYFI